MKYEAWKLRTRTILCTVHQRLRHVMCCCVQISIQKHRGWDTNKDLSICRVAGCTCGTLPYGTVVVGLFSGIDRTPSTFRFFLHVPERSVLYESACPFELHMYKKCCVVTLWYPRRGKEDSGRHLLCTVEPCVTPSKATHGRVC